MDELISGLRERAADPKRRTDRPGSISMSGPGGTLTTMFGSITAGRPPSSAAGITLSGLFGDLRRVVKANQEGRPIDADIAARTAAIEQSLTDTNAVDLPAPANAETLKRVGTRLGFPLPSDLVRLYAEIADGGFGPGGGLLAIERVASVYEELRAEPPGPRGQPWPDRLLPLVDAEPGYDCLEADAGRIVAWDPEELSERSGAKAWLRSFRPLAPSLEAWLEEWLHSRPQHEILQERVNASLLEQARQARASIGAKSLEERRAMGLPDVGWERVVWGGLGLEEDDAS